MKKGIWLAVLGLLAAAAGPAAAQSDRGLYFGGSGGYVLYDHSCENLVVPCDDDDVGFRAFAGYRFNRYLSAEFGYANLGESKAEGDLGGGLIGTRVTKIDNVFDLTGLLSFPIVNRLDGFIRLGLFHARLTVDDSIPGFPQGEVHYGDSNTGWTVGAGVQYNLGALGLRVEFQTWGDVGGSGNFQDNIYMLSAGALLQF